jgi:hypothetical protein
MIRPYRFLSTEHFNPNAFAAAAIIEGVIGTTTVSGNGAWWKRTLANFATNGTILGDGSNGEMFIFMDLMLHYCTGFSKVDEKTGKTPIERTREVFGFNKIPLFEIAVKALIFCIGVVVIPCPNPAFKISV